MTRLACALALVALLLLAGMLRDTTGATAIAFSFLGAPALGAAILIGGLAAWRQRASRANLDPSNRT